MTRKLKARWNISAWFGKKGPVAGKRKAIPFLSPVFFHCIFVFALSQFRGSDYWIEQSMSSAANRFQPVQVVLPGNANYTLTPRWMTSIIESFTLCCWVTAATKTIHINSTHGFALLSDYASSTLDGNSDKIINFPLARGVQHLTSRGRK